MGEFSPAQPPRWAAGDRHVMSGRATLLGGRITDVDLESKVVGVTRHNHDGSDRQDIARDCRAGDPLVLRREPDNAQDKNAVAVFRENGDQVGYLSASVAERLAPLLDADAPFTAVVSEVTGGTEDRPTYGVNIRIHDGSEDGPGGGAGEGAGAAAEGPRAGAAVAERAKVATGGRPELRARRGCALAVVGVIGGLVAGTALVAGTVWAAGS
jgi:hypothetical protein